MAASDDQAPFPPLSAYADEGAPAKPKKKPNGSPPANSEPLPIPKGESAFSLTERDLAEPVKLCDPWATEGVNIIAGPEVVGLVNIQLRDVPWQKALDVILSTYGYGYEQKGTIIMVTTCTLRVNAAMVGTKITIISGFKPLIHSNLALTSGA